MSDTLISELRVEWQDALRSFTISPLLAQAAFENLVNAYSSPNRYYHTLEHIQQVLQTVRQLRAYTQNEAIVQLAAWFHDAVYDSQATDNEAASARYASERLTSLGLSDDTIAAIARLILATQSHQVEADDRDGQVLLDADLAILGSSPETYQKYAWAIRQEYAWVPEAQYRAGRQRVLKTFLQRPIIYYTAWMQDAFEAIARQNLKREIEALRHDPLLPPQH